MEVAQTQRVKKAAVFTLTVKHGCKLQYFFKMQIITQDFFII
jgi:hypothetical protein